MTNLIEVTLASGSTRAINRTAYLRCTTVESFATSDAVGGVGTAIRLGSGQVYNVDEPVEYIKFCVVNSSMHINPDGIFTQKTWEDHVARTRR